MKKNYEKAQIQIAVISTEDIMVASAGFDAANEDGMSIDLLLR